MTTRIVLAVGLVAVLTPWGGNSIAEQQTVPRTMAHSPGKPEALTYDAGATAPNAARLLTSGSETNGTWSLVELTEMPGTKTTWHRHTFDQAYYVREGVFTVKVEDKSYVLPAGGYIFIPRGTPHGTANVGSALLKQLSPGHPDFQKRMSDLRKQHGTEELGTWDPRGQ